MPYSDPEKQKQAQHESYLRNKDIVRERNKEKRTKDRIWLAGLKTEPCIDCGNVFPACAMDFHHKDPSTKDFAVSYLLVMKGRARVEEEIKKCELICANCHRIRHQHIGV